MPSISLGSLFNSSIALSIVLELNIKCIFVFILLLISFIIASYDSVYGSYKLTATAPQNSLLAFNTSSVNPIPFVVYDGIIPNSRVIFNIFLKSGC